MNSINKKPEEDINNNTLNGFKTNGLAGEGLTGELIKGNKNGSIKEIADQINWHSSSGQTNYNNNNNNNIWISMIAIELLLKYKRMKDDLVVCTYLKWNTHSLIKGTQFWDSIFSISNWRSTRSTSITKKSCIHIWHLIRSITIQSLNLYI